MPQFILAILAAIDVQVAVLKRKRPRPTLNSLDRFFWTTLCPFWSRWTDVLVIVKPETVIGWHRAGFRLYWRCRSLPRGGRPRIAEEIRTLIRRLASGNPTWRAPKIHGEVQKLGFVVSERTVARYLRRVPRRGDPDKRWLTFLENHREMLVAFDFFTVPTLTFNLLYCFFVIEHGRRKILHFNVTRHPTADWVVQQLREAFPEASPYRYVILDHDSKFDAEVIAFLKSAALKPKRISVRAPWQNGLAERWVGSCPAKSSTTSSRSTSSISGGWFAINILYYREDRIHDALHKDTPNRRRVEQRPSANAVVFSSACLGGLHHRYSWQQAA